MHYQIGGSDGGPARSQGRLGFLRRVERPFRVSPPPPAALCTRAASRTARVRLPRPGVEKRSYDGPPLAGMQIWGTCMHDDEGRLTTARRRVPSQGRRHAKPETWTLATSQGVGPATTLLRWLFPFPWLQMDATTEATRLRSESSATGTSERNLWPGQLVVRSLPTCDPVTRGRPHSRRGWPEGTSTITTSVFHPAWSVANGSAGIPRPNAQSMDSTYDRCGWYSIGAVVVSTARSPLWRTWSGGSVRTLTQTIDARFGLRAPSPRSAAPTCLRRTYRSTRFHGNGLLASISGPGQASEAGTMDNTRVSTP